MQKVAIKTSESDFEDHEVLLDLNRNYVRSALELDVRWYSENLSEDFYITAPDGALLNCEAFLKRIANPYPGTEAEAVDVMIRIWATLRSFTPATGIRGSPVTQGMVVTRIFTNGEMAGGFVSPRTSCASETPPKT